MQGIQEVTRTGVAISTITSYVGEDRPEMTKEDFHKNIVSESGCLVSLSLLAPVYGTTTARLEPKDLFHKLVRKGMTLHDVSLFDMTFTVVCPNHTDDPTAAI